MNQDKAYLGDAVYVDHDGFQIRLYTDYGYGPKSEIFLEPEVLYNFQQYLIGLKSSPKHKALESIEESNK